MDNFNPKEESKGLGDSIAKVTHFFRIDKVADAVAKMVGAEGCGCSERREFLNQLFPYQDTTRSFKVLKTITEYTHPTTTCVYEMGSIIKINRSHDLFGLILELQRDGFLVELD